MSRRLSGLMAWLVQRITAIYLAVVLPPLLLYLLCCPPEDYTAWQQQLNPLWVRALLWLLVPALALHAWVGIRDVLIDYVKPTAVRLILFSLFGGLLILCALWAWQVLFRLAPLAAPLIG